MMDAATSPRLSRFAPGISVFVGLPRHLAILVLVLSLATVSASPQSRTPISSPTSAAPSPVASLPLAPRPDKNRAQKAYQAGLRGEQSGDWETAYAAYSEATVYAPTAQEYAQR